MFRPPLILASASPRRSELLAGLGIPFTVVVPDVTEHEEESADPRVMVAHNAALKADWVARQRPQAVVLGADTTVCVGDTVLNKPRDAAEARAMLRRLSGRAHSVHTGVALRGPEAHLCCDAVETSRVRFKILDEAAIDAYLARVHTLDKAGGYAIQEHPEIIIDGFDGSLSNIIGLPMELMKHILTQGGLLD